MRNLIRKVSHNSRCAPLSTVNFAMKPRRPVVVSGGTVSSEGITSLVIWPTALNYSVIPSEVEEPVELLYCKAMGSSNLMTHQRSHRCSARHVSKVHSQLAESSMANKSASGPGNAPKCRSAAMVGATNGRSINVANTKPSASRRPLSK